MHDPEGDLLAAIRDRIGPEIPIGVTFDLHANVTRRRAELATFIIGYKTNPFLRKFGTVVFCEVSDAVGAGAPGENTWILKSLMEEGPELRSYLFIRDAEAARKAFLHDLDDDLKLVVGGKLDTVYNRPVAFSGRLIKKTDGPLGKTVILLHQGIHLIVTELPSSAWSPSAFTDLGLSLWKADIVVVKNLFPFRYRFLLYNRKTVNVMTSGTTDIDVFALQYTTIPRPIYPLDEIESWQ